MLNLTRLACAVFVLLSAGSIFTQTTKDSKGATTDKSTKAKAKSPPPAAAGENQPGVEAGREASVIPRSNLQLQVAILVNGSIDSLSGVQPNQEFPATLDQPLMAAGQVIAPRGTRALLRISRPDQAPANAPLELQLVALDMGGKFVRTDGSKFAPEATRAINLNPQTISATGTRIQVPAGARLSFTLPDAAAAALSANAPSGPPQPVTAGDFTLAITACTPAARSVNCSLTLSNQGTTRDVMIAAETQGYDASGRLYRPASSQIGRAANQATVTGGSRVPVTISFANVDPASGSIVRLQVVLSWGDTPADRATFTFANIPSR